MQHSVSIEYARCRGCTTCMKNCPTQAIRVRRGKATILTETGVETVIDCDAIINAADMLPNKGLLDGIGVSETYAIGDCAEPFNIALAIRGGNDAGRAV